MANPNLLFTGARARFLLNGVKVGYASSVSGSESIDYEAIRCLDNIEVQEHVPVAYDTTLEAGYFRIIGETIKSRGWMPTAGSSPEQHLLNILNTGILTATIEDALTGEIAYTFEGVRIASNNFSVDARGVVGNRVSFVCLRSRDESET